MTKLYAVSQGSYSDYGIVAIFSSKDAAELFMQRHPASRYDEYNSLEEYELDPGLPQMREGLSHWWVQMDEAGDVSNVETWNPGSGCKSDEAFRPPAGFRGGTRRWFNSYCWATDRSHAVKIVNERRIQMLAQPVLGEGHAHE